LLTFFVAFSTLVLKLSFSQSLILHSRLSLPQLRPIVVWQSLSPVDAADYPDQLTITAHYNVVILTYLLLVFLRYLLLPRRSCFRECQFVRLSACLSVSTITPKVFASDFHKTTALKKNSSSLGLILLKMAEWQSLWISDIGQ